jgi:hypothetical protein
MDNFCQHVALTKVLHQGKICLNQHKEGLGYFCNNFVYMVEPILMALMSFDGKQPYMGKLWFVMEKLEQHVLSLWGQ